jgi:hypothetical protein
VAAGILAPLLPLRADERDATAREAMRDLYGLSRLAVQVASTAELVSQGLSEQRVRIPPENLAAASGSVRRAYDAGALEKAVLAGLESRYDARHAPTAHAWLQSPLGRRITRLEANSSTAEAAQAMREFALALRETPASPERVAAAKRLDEALGTTEFTVELTIVTSLGIAIALDATLPAERRSDREEMRARIESRREEFRSMFRPMSVVSFLYTYRDLSLEEIDAYLAFAESDAGRWYTDATTGAFLEAMTAASLGIGDAPGE